MGLLALRSYTDGKHRRIDWSTRTTINCECMGKKISLYGSLFLMTCRIDWLWMILFLRSRARSRRHGNRNNSHSTILQLNFSLILSFFLDFGPSRNLRELLFSLFFFYENTQISTIHSAVLALVHFLTIHWFGKVCSPNRVVEKEMKVRER